MPTFSFNDDYDDVAESHIRSAIYDEIMYFKANC